MSRVTARSIAIRTACMVAAFALLAGVAGWPVDGTRIWPAMALLGLALGEAADRVFGWWLGSRERHR